jgi:hypothetical protein
LKFSPVKSIILLEAADPNITQTTATAIVSRLVPATILSKALMVVIDEDPKFLSVHYVQADAASEYVRVTDERPP